LKKFHTTGPGVVSVSETLTLYVHCACNDGLAPSEAEVDAMLDSLNYRAAARLLGKHVAQREWFGTLPFSDSLGFAIYRDFE